MLRSAAGAARVRGPAVGRTTRYYVFDNAGTRGVQQRQLDSKRQHCCRRRCAATAVATSQGTAKRPPAAVAAALSLRPISCTAAATIPRRGGNGCYVQQQYPGGTGGPIKFGTPQPQQPPSLVSTRRHLSTSRRGRPPRRSLPEKVFAGMVMAVLAAWGLMFGGKGRPMDPWMHLFISLNI